MNPKMGMGRFLHLLLAICVIWAMGIRDIQVLGSSRLGANDERTVLSMLQGSLLKLEAQQGEVTREEAEAEEAAAADIGFGVKSGYDDTMTQQKVPAEERLFIQLLGIEGAGHTLVLDMLSALARQSGGVMAIMPRSRTGSPDAFRGALEAAVHKVYVFRPPYPSGPKHWVPNATLIMDAAHEAGWNYLGLGLYRDPIMSIARALRQNSWPVDSYLSRVDNCFQILETLCLAHETTELPWRPKGSVPSTKFQALHLEALSSTTADKEHIKIAGLLYSVLSGIIPRLRKEQVVRIVHNAFSPKSSAMFLEKDLTVEMETLESQRTLSLIDSKYGLKSNACMLRSSSTSALPSFSVPPLVLYTPLKRATQKVARLSPTLSQFQPLVDSVWQLLYTNQLVDRERCRVETAERVNGAIHGFGSNLGSVACSLVYGVLTNRTILLGPPFAYSSDECWKEDIPIPLECYFDQTTTCNHAEDLDRMQPGTTWLIDHPRGTRGGRGKDHKEDMCSSDAACELIGPLCTSIHPKLGRFWLKSTVFQFFLAPNPKFRKQLDELKKKIMTRQNTAERVKGTRVIGMHIRGNDKTTVIDLNKEARGITTRTPDLDDFFKIARLIRRRDPAATTIYVATDQADTLAKLQREEYAMWTILTAEKPGSSAFEGFRAGNTGELQYPEVIVEDLVLLSECDYFIGTHSSNVGRITAGLWPATHEDMSSFWFADWTDLPQAVPGEESVFLHPHFEWSHEAYSLITAREDDFWNSEAVTTLRPLTHHAYRRSSWIGT